MPHAAPIRLVLTGPESTGKTALTLHLARHLGVPHALEYARVYLEQHGPRYDYDLLLPMSRGHLAYQREHVPDETPLGVLDTDLLNYKVWCEVVFGRCHPEILAALAQEQSHVYLLCYPDLPWESDPLREHPHAREMLFERHRRAIEEQGRRYEVIRGLGPAREVAAEAAALRLLAT